MAPGETQQSLRIGINKVPTGCYLRDFFGEKERIS